MFPIILWLLAACHVKHIQTPTVQFSASILANLNDFHLDFHQLQYILTHFNSFNPMTCVSAFQSMTMEEQQLSTGKSFQGGFFWVELILSYATC